MRRAHGFQRGGVAGGLDRRQCGVDGRGDGGFGDDGFGVYSFRELSGLRHKAQVYPAARGRRTAGYAEPPVAEAAASAEACRMLSMASLGSSGGRLRPRPALPAFPPLAVRRESQRANQDRDRFMIR